MILGYGRGAAPFPAYLGTAGALAPYTGERVIVTDKTAADTSLVQAGAGCSTASPGDTVLQWSGDGTLAAGEVVRLDAERMLVEEVLQPGVASVVRSWDGTQLAAHSAAEIYAYRSLTVLRGELGTAAAAWPEGTAVWRHRVPPLVRDLAIAVALNQVLQETSGYSRTVGAGDAAMPASGIALDHKWASCRTRFGRKARIGAI